MKRQVLIEADSVKEARKQIESQLTQGLEVHSMEVLRAEWPVSIECEAQTADSAFEELERQVPSEAVVLEREVIRRPSQRTIVVEALDERMARDLATSEKQDDEQVDAMELTVEGKKGILGIGKKPDRYEVQLAKRAQVRLTYREKAQVSFTIGPKKKQARFTTEPKKTQASSTIGRKDLLEVVRAKDLQGLKEALEAGAAVNVSDDGGYTPLMLAALYGEEEMVELLIAEGANVNAATKWGATALTRAAQDGKTKIVELLLSNGADVNRREYDGYTALSRAAMNGHEKIVQMLIAKGADLNIRTKHAHTALTLAQENRRSRIVELLQNAG